MSLFPNEDILTKEEIESWKSFGDGLSSKDDRDLFKDMLNDCCKYAAAINALQPEQSTRQFNQKQEQESKDKFAQKEESQVLSTLRDFRHMIWIGCPFVLFLNRHFILHVIYL
jgi:hypothetical protein